MASEKKISTFTSYKKDLDYQNPIRRQKFCFDVKDWMDEAFNVCTSA